MRVQNFLQGLITAVFISSKGEGLVVAHEVIVVLWEGEQVWVDQEPHLVHVEGGEHLADVWDEDAALVEHVLLLTEKHAVGDGGVDVRSRVVVQAHHVPLGEEVEESRRQEGEEANDAAERSLQGQTLACQRAVEQDVRHEEQTGSRRRVGEHLHSWKSRTRVKHHPDCYYIVINTIQTVITHKHHLSGTFQTLTYFLPIAFGVTVRSNLIG